MEKIDIEWNDKCNSHSVGLHLKKLIDDCKEEHDATKTQV